MRNTLYTLTLLWGFIFSATLHVPSDYGTIQDALNAASHGDIGSPQLWDTVAVAPGYYMDGPYMITKNLVLASHAVTQDNIETLEWEDDDISGYQVTNDNITGTHLTGFTIDSNSDTAC